MMAAHEPHSHDHGRQAWHRLRHLLTPHSHDTAGRVDDAFESSRSGVHALWISLAALGLTALVQAVVVSFSGSVALLGDTLRNVAGALTAVPLGIAVWLGRRAATRAYTYGFGRAEDLAGAVVVLVIAASAAASAVLAVRRLAEPVAMTHLPSTTVDAGNVTSF
jgi:divalent metal cation (Fe/Co/Zn/Cd) transporter